MGCTSKSLRCGIRTFAYLADMFQLLHSGRLVLDLVRRINQCFPDSVLTIMFETRLAIL